MGSTSGVVGVGKSLRCISRLADVEPQFTSDNDDNEICSAVPRKRCCCFSLQPKHSVSSVEMMKIMPGLN